MGFFIKYIIFFIGGTSTKLDIDNFNNLGANIIIGSPGKLKELFEFETFYENIRDLEILIMDEADRLMDNEYN